MASNAGPLGSPILHLLELVSRAPRSEKTPEQIATQGRYNYTPSVAAAVIFLVIYAIAMVLNQVQMFWHRAWFWWVMNLAVASKWTPVPLSQWTAVIDALILTGLQWRRLGI